MKKLIRHLNLIIIMLLLLSGVSLRSASANPKVGTTVAINPSSTSVSDCGIVYVYIDVNNVSNLYGLDVHVTFDPAVLEVVDLNPATSPVEIEPVDDPSLNFQAGFIAENVVNNFTGTIWYVATQTNPTLPASGSGHVARISFRARSSSSSNITITSSQLADRNGGHISATNANGSVTAITSVAPTPLSISRLSASQVQLSWLVASEVSHYHLYRSPTPYFNTVDPAYQVLTPLAPGLTQTFNDRVLGNVNINYFYTLRAECSAGGLSGPADEVGKFEYSLLETETTDYTWVALPLTVTGLAKASDLASHIEANSSGAVTVLTVS